MQASVYATGPAERLALLQALPHGYEPAREERIRGPDTTTVVNGDGVVADNDAGETHLACHHRHDLTTVRNGVVHAPVAAVVPDGGEGLNDLPRCRRNRTSRDE
jgi:hypothetical protein